MQRIAGSCPTPEVDIYGIKASVSYCLEDSAWFFTWAFAFDLVELGGLHLDGLIP